MTVKIADEMREMLDNELQKNALNFCDYLNEKQLIPNRWFGPGFWRVPYKQHYLCGIHIKKDAWRFWFWSGDYSSEFDEKYLRTAIDHVRPCINCTTDCQFGKNTKIFGKEFINTCVQFPIQFENPDDNTLECVKKLLEYWKTATPNNYSWHYCDNPV